MTNYIAVQITEFFHVFALRQRGSISISESMPVWWKVANSIESTSFAIFSSDLLRWWTLFMKKKMMPINVSHHRFLGKFLVVLVSSTRTMRYSSITTTKSSNSGFRTSKALERLGSWRLAGKTATESRCPCSMEGKVRSSWNLRLRSDKQICCCCFSLKSFPYTPKLPRLSIICETRAKKMFTGKFIWKFAAFPHFCRLFVSPLSEEIFNVVNKKLKTQRRRSSALVRKEI